MEELKKVKLNKHLLSKVTIILCMHVSVMGEDLPEDETDDPELCAEMEEVQDIERAVNNNEGLTQRQLSIFKTIIEDTIKGNEEALNRCLNTIEKKPNCENINSLHYEVEQYRKYIKDETKILEAIVK